MVIALLGSKSKKEHQYNKCMNKVLSALLTGAYAISRRKRFRDVDPTTTISLCIATASLVEALKDQVVALQEQLEIANPKLLPAPKVNLAEYNKLMTQVTSEATRLRDLIRR
jgi:hypothetical protein